jgi:diaminopimelate epimerase
MGQQTFHMPFTKLQALGNDFIVVRAGDLPPAGDLRAIAIAMCDRHLGAGADGVVYVWEDDGVACDTRIFNADGSEAEVSGNGIRCVAAWRDEAGLWRRDADLHLRTAAGLKVVRRAPGQRFAMEMGAPRFDTASLPMAIEPPRAHFVDEPLRAGVVDVRVTAVSVGNPHCSVFVADADATNAAELGPVLERHPVFPRRTNVEFVQVLARDRLRVRFWERGVGATLSSGTGAAAALVAAVANGRVGRLAKVEMPAGAVEVEWREKDDVVVLTGPAELVYKGVWLARL